MPVFLFAVSQCVISNNLPVIGAFLILHLLVYPSSNGYNSYMDRDETAIGGLAAPLQPTRQLFTASVLMDLLAIALSFAISVWFAVGILLYIIASRAYSYRGIRLKKHPLTGFITVFFFQGFFIYFLTCIAANSGQLLQVPLLPCFISSLLIGALYPLTQVFQHEEDRKDGVVTISMLLGKRGSFLFSMLLFLMASAGMYVLYVGEERAGRWFLFLICMFPVVLFFVYWMFRVWKQPAEASFKNSLRMNLISTICTSLFFIICIIYKH